MKPKKEVMISVKTNSLRKNKYQPKASKVKLLLINADFYQEQKGLLNLMEILALDPFLPDQ